jgi:hypothetical protein
MAKNNTNEPSGWVGWVFFAGFMLALNGVLQAIAGLTALLKDDYYLVTERAILSVNYTAWGWIHLIMGIVVLCAGVALFKGSMWARVVGVIAATLSFIAQFAFVSAYPIWSITAMVISILVIYALTVHGAEVKEIE